MHATDDEQHEGAAPQHGGYLMDQNDPMLKVVYVLMAAIAGSVTALSFLRWREMTWGEICLTLFVGFSFAIFVTPWIAHIAFGLNAADVRTIAGLTYVSASGSNILLPLLIRRLKRAVGEGEA
jgi:hypothetical protein